MRIPKLNETIRRQNWSIGIYSGSSPLHLAASDINNPVLQARDVTDIPAEFVADPFMIRLGDEWHMYFEVINKLTNKGCIGWASSPDGLTWQYRKIVIEEPFHMSYPYVFEWNGAYYMIPETCEAHAIRLYRASHLPGEWSYVGNLLEGYFVDSTIHVHDGLLWLFTGSTDKDTLRLYYAQHLLGQWKEHPLSPIISNNANIARPSGRMTSSGGRMYRFTQDTEPEYGHQVRAFEITKLTTAAYEEQEVAIILKGTGQAGDWNADGMHHIDAQPLGPDRWLACVDGHYFRERSTYARKAESIYYALKSRWRKRADKSLQRSR